MALTLVSSPANIDNSAIFNVTTDLIEEAAHTNLRIRADVYHEGIIKAVVEKPKGLADFDFGDILKSLTPGLKFVRDSGDLVKTGTIGANLITGWSVNNGTYTTLTKAANVINSAICTVNSSVLSNNIAVTTGDLFLLYSPDLTSSGTFPGVSGTIVRDVYLFTNKSIILMATTTGNITIGMGHVTNQNWSGSFYLHKITTNRTTVGNPLAPYFVTFIEVYEDASGVTQIGTPVSTKVFRFVPAIGDGTAFTEFVLHDATSLFANKTLKNNVTKFYTINPSEYWIQFFTEYVELELFHAKEGGAANHATHPICYEGWGAVIINIGELMASVTTYMAFYLQEISAHVTISELIGILIDSSAIAERTVLEFDGLVGGKEYLAFEGIKDIEFTTIRNYYAGSKKNRKPISFTGINRQKLETRFKDMANADYLKSLLISDNVKRLEPSYGVPSDVTILTDSVTIDKGREFFTNRLDIEYEY